jgi:2,5-diketo-D-gluconate reductase A
MSVPSITLKDGHKIPQIGLGLWQIKEKATFARAFKAAFDCGYRHFDSAQEYGNEQLLGMAWRGTGAKREDFFLTTKISVRNFRQKMLVSSFEQSLKNLQTDYIDLLLLHFPVPLLRKKAWVTLEEIQTAGMAHSIGVSNYTIRHLNELQTYAHQLPAVNQVELHVFLQQPELIQHCRENSITVEGYSPLAHGRMMVDPVVQSIAAKHSKSYAQIMLRWLIEQDVVILPKSVTVSRIKENIAVFDFSLDKEDLAALKDLNRNLRTCWSPVHVP